MAVNHLFKCLLFILNFKTGFSAEIPVFVKTGHSVNLEIPTEQPQKFVLLSWTYYKTDNIVTYVNGGHVNYHRPMDKNRVDFNTKTFSLTLENMQKTDSGLYTAKIAGDLNIDIVTYNVSVIDPVEAPVLNVNSNWSSSDSCTVNFTCRAQDLTINSSYQNNRCSPENVTSQHINTVIIFCSDKFILCNYSNPISWKEDKMEIKPLCVNKKENVTNDKQTESSSFWLVYVIVAAGVIVIGVIGVISLTLFFCNKRKKGTQDAGGTVYEQVQMLPAAEKNTHSAGEDVEGTQDAGGTVYDQVQMFPAAENIHSAGEDVEGSRNEENQE